MPDEITSDPAADLTNDLTPRLPQGTGRQGRDPRERLGAQPADVQEDSGVHHAGRLPPALPERRRGHDGSGQPQTGPRLRPRQSATGGECHGITMCLQYIRNIIVDIVLKQTLFIISQTTDNAKYFTISKTRNK